MDPNPSNLGGACLEGPKSWIACFRRGSIVVAMAANAATATQTKIEGEPLEPCAAMQEARGGGEGRESMDIKLHQPRISGMNFSMHRTLADTMTHVRQHVHYDCRNNWSQSFNLLPPLIQACCP